MSIRSPAIANLTSRRLSAGSPAISADALRWRAAAIANGGTVSDATFSAVNTFCVSIESALIRGSFARLNLFCGGNLSACLTPLYTGTSPTGTQLGNASDTNNNFVSGDYSESSGLVGNGSTKYLATGLAPSAFPFSLSSIHLSFSGTSLETSGDKCSVATYNGSGSGGIYASDIYAAYVSGRASRLSSLQNSPSIQFPVVSSPGTSESHFLGTRAGTAGIVCRSGVSAATTIGAVTAVSHSFPWTVFALNNAGSIVAYTAARLRMYSIGASLTESQALAFSNAVAAFNTALGRS